MDPDAVTDPNSYLSRTFHSSIVLGNYLYIDGGQVAYTLNGQNYSLPANSTYSVDLSIPWAYRTVQVNRIQKQNAPSLNSENLWLDTSGSFFYSYNGDVSGILPLSQQQAPPPSQLYKFTPDGSYGGAWESVAAVSIDRATGALGTYGNGFGYAIGGWKSSHTSSSLGAASVRAPGVVKYDMKTQSWSNISDSTTDQFGYVSDGITHLLPDLGQNGVLLIMGGVTRSARGTGSYSLNSFENITLYDPTTNSVTYQTTSGSIPVGRTHACSVMTRGNNNSYEIFIVNGDATDPNIGESSSTPSNQNKALDTVYALSIPSFKWFKGNATGVYSRWGHTCNIASNNSRQMLSIGGAPVGNTDTLLIRDYLPQGIAIFDMTKMAWSADYDPTLPPYTSPPIIIDDYGANGWTPRTGWSTPQVEQWFAHTNSSTTPPTSSSGSRNSSSSSNTGAIAGGVVGGLAALALAAFVVWFFLRRRRHNTSHPEESIKLEIGSRDVDAKPELNGSSESQLAEMNGLGWAPVYELGNERHGGAR